MVIDAGWDFMHFPSQTIILLYSKKTHRLIEINEIGKTSLAAQSYACLFRSKIHGVCMTAAKFH